MISRKVWKKRKMIVFVSILIWIVLLTGCWSRRELNQLAILAAMGTDLEGDKIKLTFEVMKPSPPQSGSGGSGSEPESVFVQSRGDSLFEAIRNVTMKFDRKLFLPHCRVFVFSEEVAKEGVLDYLDFWNRDHESRRTAYIVIAEGNSAADVMDVIGGLENTFAAYLESIIENQSANAKTVKVTIREFMKAYYAEGREPIAVGVIKKQKREQIGEGASKYEINAEGAAVFSQGRLIGQLNGEETMGMNFIRNEVKSGILVVPSLEGNTYTSVEILKVGSKNTVEIKEGKLKIVAKITMTGMISEETSTISLREPDNISNLEKETEKVIEQIVMHVIDKAQKELEADIFGFGRILMNKHYDLWQQIKDEWHEIFAKADIQIEVDVNLQRRGVINNPIKRKEVD